MFNIKVIPQNYILEISTACDPVLNDMFRAIPASRVMDLTVDSMIAAGLDAFIIGADDTRAGIDNVIDMLAVDTMDGILAVAGGYRIEVLDADANSLTEASYEVFTRVGEKLMVTGLLPMCREFVSQYDASELVPQLLIQRHPKGLKDFYTLTVNKNAYEYAAREH